MKLLKILKLLFMPFVLIAMIPVMAFAQTVEMPGLDASSYFATFASMAGVVVFIAAWLNKMLNAKGVLKQLLSWLVSIVLAFIGWGLNLGMFAEVGQWWIVIVYGLCTGLIANGIFDVALIKNVLRALKIEPKTDQ